jgi:hypothetical protein
LPLAGLLVDAGTVAADFLELAAVTLIRRHELDGAVAVPVVVPVHERRHPLACLVFIANDRLGWSDRYLTVRNSDSE